jgi:TolA-binding protein
MRIPRAAWLLPAALGLGWACASDMTLRAYLDAHFWLPYAKWPASFEKKNVSRMEQPYAGMAASGKSSLEKLSEAYAVISDPATGSSVPADIHQMLAAAQADPALTAAEREEVALIGAKIEMRAAGFDAEDLNKAADSMKAFLRTAQQPRFRSEARGWLAHIYYRLGKQTEAGKIYLDELNRGGSNLSREVLLNSLKFTYGYDGGAGLLARLDEYFDTPEHAIFAIQLLTNPHWDRDEDFLKVHSASETQRTYARITALLEKHRGLLAAGDGGGPLASLGMRVALRMGDPPGALKIAASVPAAAAIRQDPDFIWMLAAAHFLSHQYAAAEQPLLRLFRSSSASKMEKASAAYGLCGVYQKTGNTVEQIRFALWLRSAPGQFDSSVPPVYFAVSGFDLGLLLDAQASDEDIRQFLAKYPNAPNVRLAKYALAVRLARENRYTESAEIYEAIGQPRRGPRMRQLAKLYAAANLPDSGEAKYQLAAFLAAHSDGIYFNDSLWHGFQQGALIADEDGRLTGKERESYMAKERRLQDEQEELWRAWHILQGVVDDEGRTELGRKAAQLAVRCVRRISRRFGREDEIRDADIRLSGWLSAGEFSTK